jgi:hypothetical protein
MAFDCVNQGILLPKLSYYGITGIFYSLIQSYLEEKHQRIKLVNNDYKSCSSWGMVKHGVPQGSIFRPFLFLHYSNEIMKITNTIEPVLSGLMTGCNWPDNKKITDNRRRPENDLLMPPYVYVKII